MSHNPELENQEPRPTTMQDGSNSTNLPAEELPEQDLEAVSGGIVATLPAIPFMDEIEDSATPDAPPDPVDDSVNGLAGDLMDTAKSVGNTLGLG